MYVLSPVVFRAWGEGELGVIVKQVQKSQFRAMNRIPWMNGSDDSTLNALNLSDFMLEMTKMVHFVFSVFDPNNLKMLRKKRWLDF